MHISKTLAALVAASSLGGGALALVAPGTAFAVAPPAGDQAVYGVATANGTPTADIGVTLYDALPDANGDLVELGETDTDADGSYYFDFTSGGTNTDPTAMNSLVDPPSGSQVKIVFNDDRTLTSSSLELKYQWYAGQTTFKRATPITVAAAGTTTVPNVSLGVQSGISGSVSIPAPAGYYYQGFVTAYDADDNFADQAGFNSDPADDASDQVDGLTTYTLRGLTPGQDYKLYFGGSALPTSGTGEPINYIGHFYGGDQTFGSATVVTAPASGTITGGINGSLTNAISAETAPSIVGQVAPGKTLSVDPGTWSLKADNEYSYQWLLNGAAVSTSPTYKVAKANLGKKLQVVVTNRVGDYLGSAATPATKVKYAAKLKAKAKAVYVNGKRVVQIKGHLKVQGVKKKKLAKALKGVKVTVYEVSKTDDTVMVKVGKAKVKKGDLLVTVKGLISGKHYLEIDLTGKKVAEVLKTVKAKV